MRCLSLLTLAITFIETIHCLSGLYHDTDLHVGKTLARGQYKYANINRKRSLRRESIGNSDISTIPKHRTRRHEHATLHAKAVEKHAEVSTNVLRERQEFARKMVMELKALQKRSMTELADIRCMTTLPPRPDANCDFTWSRMAPESNADLVRYCAEYPANQCDWLRVKFCSVKCF